MTIYKVQGKVTSKRTGLPVPYAHVEILKVEQVGPNYQVAPLPPIPGATGLGKDTTDDYGVFEISFDFSPVTPSRPSIIIRISQTVDAGVRYVHNENPAVHTRWNIGDVLVVNIKVEEECIASNPLTFPSLPDYGFVFTRVGLIGVDKISQTNGYAYPYPTTPATPASMDSNAPFGSTLHIAGWFGYKCDATVDYYRILYQRAGGASHGISDPLSNTYYDFTNKTWKTVSLGPFSKTNGLDGTTVDNLYKFLKLNTGTPLAKATTPWQFPDLLAAWDTTKLEDGLYTLQIESYKETTPNIVTPTLSLGAWALVPDSVYGTLKLQIDNSAPVCRILEDGIRHGPEGQPWDALTPVTACATIPLTAGTKISVRFKAYDAKGHLRLYNLMAMYGHNQIVVPPPTSPDKAKDDYSTPLHAAAVAWYGSETFTTEYRASGGTAPPDVSYDSTEMPSCAYQFRLRVDKRTNNGYGAIYCGYEDTVHVTIMR